jgi:hypothetical protein
MDTTPHVNRSNSRTWVWLGKNVPKNEITYIVQSSVLILVIIVSLVNLSLGTGVHDLNISLLASGLGAFLPGPSFPVFKERVLHVDEDTVDNMSVRRTS